MKIKETSKKLLLGVALTVPALTGCGEHLKSLETLKKEIQQNETDQVKRFISDCLLRESSRYQPTHPRRRYRVDTSEQPEVIKIITTCVDESDMEIGGEKTFPVVVSTFRNPDGTLDYGMLIVEVEKFLQNTRC